MPVQIKHKFKGNAPQGPPNLSKKSEKGFSEKFASKVEDCSRVLDTGRLKLQSPQKREQNEQNKKMCFFRRPLGSAGKKPFKFSFPRGGP